MTSNPDLSGIYLVFYVNIGTYTNLKIHLQRTILEIDKASYLHTDYQDSKLLVTVLIQFKLAYWPFWAEQHT